jgi:hypothetical protein
MSNLPASRVFFGASFNQFLPHHGEINLSIRHRAFLCKPVREADDVGAVEEIQNAVMDFAIPDAKFAYAIAKYVGKGTP